MQALSPKLKYGIALGVVAAAIVLSLALQEVTRARDSFVLFFAAIAVAAGIGGIIPGLLATLLSCLAIDLLLFPPRYSFVIYDAHQMADLLLFGTVGLIASGVSGALHEAQRRANLARQEALSTQRSLVFLADASVALDETLVVEETLDRIAHIAVPSLADWCAIDLLDPEGGARLVAAAHKDPARKELIHQLQSRYPPNARGQSPIQKVLHSGESDIALDIGDGALVSVARDAQHLEAMRALQIRSYLCVPLRARGRILGTLLFVSNDKDRYATAQRLFAEDLARRAALAVDNARLYEEAQREIDQRTKTEAELESRQEVIEGLNERLRLSMIETHHRVKNNLQVIAAMIDMRMMDGDDMLPREDFERLGAYVRTMAAVHDILTHGSKTEEGTQFVSAQAILEKLLPLMESTSGDRKLIYTIQDAPLTAKQGTSLALLVNELVSNASKHGRGLISVRLAAAGGTASLEVCDDGDGFPEGFDPAKAANTGLDLILSLARWDMGGEASFTNRPEGGARIVVTFPLPAAVPPPASPPPVPPGPAAQSAVVSAPLPSTVQTG